ncbi:MAG: tetratricopeptide repeat protein [Planctomycetota bacterium]
MSDERGTKPGFLDRLPLFGAFRRARGWMRRNKGWLYLAIAVAVLYVVGPLLTLVAQFVKIFAPAIQTLLNNPVGRFLFYNALALLLLWWVWRKVRGGVVRVLGLHSMRAFLDGMNAMVLGRWAAAVPRFEKVVRRSRWLRLEDAVPEHRDIAADARVKIATCHHRLRRADDALRWLHSVREQDILTEHVRRSHAELRALTYDIHDEMEEETILKELERTQSRDRKNRRILLALRDRVEASGDLERAKAVVQRIVAASEGLDREQAERDLALLEYRLAHKALGAGETSAPRKGLGRALSANPGDVRSALLLGDIALRDGDVRGALKAWSRAVGLPVFDRIAALLESGRLAGDKEMDFLLQHFPYAGTMLALAEHHRKRRDFRRARAAVEKVLQAAGESFPVLRLYAACLEGEGDSAKAADLYRRALSMSFGYGG